MLKTLIFFTLFLLIAGCTTGTQPIITYSGEHPLSDTSVLVLRAFNGNDLGQILSVDGKETSCWQVGCPFWVRVIPGQHSFRITYALFNNGISSHLQGELDVSSLEMKARHIYEGRLIPNEADKTFRIHVADLGENPNYSIDMGLKGVNQKNYKVSF